MSMSEEDLFEDDYEPETFSSEPPGTPFLPLIALTIPVLAGTVLLLMKFSWISIAISIGTVAATTIVMTVDATLLGRIDREGHETEGAPTIFLGMCLLWFVFYPVAFFRRRKFADPDLTLPALVATVFFVSTPFLNQVVGASGLPECDSPEVQELLVGLVRGMAVGEDLESIDGHRELRFDEAAEIRYGHCVAHTTYGEMGIDYEIKWENQGVRRYSVIITLSDLPSCDHPIVLKILEQLIRQTRPDLIFETIDGYQELRFDSESEIRFCRCVIHTADSDHELKYLVEWQNRDKGEFYVRIPPTELPPCDSPEVTELLENLVRKTPGYENVSSIDGHREVRFDPENNTRFGLCTVHSVNGDAQIRYMVYWGERERGFLIVRILPDELPACNDPEIIRMIENLIKTSPTGEPALSIDGHRELRFDRDAQIRFGQCVVHLAESQQEVNFVVEWGDREVGYFIVRIPPAELPACTSPEVARILQQISQTTPIADKITSIDGYRELRFDAQTNVRYGRCVVRTSEGDFEAFFKVEWQDQERGMFQVEIFEEKPLSEPDPVPGKTL